jgi:hypothetical protein
MTFSQQASWLPAFSPSAAASSPLADALQLDINMSHSKPSDGGRLSNASNLHRMLDLEQQFKVNSPSPSKICRCIKIYGEDCTKLCILVS